MLSNKILSRSVKFLHSSRMPYRNFFQNGKNTQENDKTNEEVKKPDEEVIAIKLPEFTEDELNMTRLNHKTVLKSIEPYKHHNNKAYGRLVNEIYHLYREKDHIPSLKQEIKSLDEINKLNHEKL